MTSSVITFYGIHIHLVAPARLLLPFAFPRSTMAQPALGLLVPSFQPSTYGVTAHRPITQLQGIRIFILNHETLRYFSFPHPIALLSAASSLSIDSVFAEQAARFWGPSGQCARLEDLDLRVRIYSTCGGELGADALYK